LPLDRDGDNDPVRNSLFLTSQLMVDWNIQSRSETCETCQKPFVDKEAFHTLLFESKGSHKRSDVCDTCWKEQHGQGATDRKGFVSCWQSVFTVPPPRPPEAIQKDTAESLLRKLFEKQDPQHAAAMFILAVMLERKRMLKVKAQLTEEGRRVFVYEHAKTGDLYRITDPNLQLAQLEKVQRDVAQLLETGLQTPETAATPASDESTETTDSGEDVEEATNTETSPEPEQQPEPQEPIAG
jgi:hypothetical protein